MKKTAVVMGGVGLCGHKITKKLLARGFKVVVADRRAPSNTLDGVEYKISSECDVFDPKYMMALVTDANATTVVNSVNIASLSSKPGLDIAVKIREFVSFVVEPILKLGIIWLNIGTVATGGMGRNMCFTHGDESDGKISEGLWRKKTAASDHTGFLHLFGRTPGYRCGEVRPMGVIGFEPFSIRPVNVPGLQRDPQFVIAPTVALNHPREISFKIVGPYKAPAARWGENGEFGCEEAIAISDPAMMGVVTAEAVAMVAMKVLGQLIMSEGGCPICTPVLPDVTSANVRDQYVYGMERVVRKAGVPSVAFGNLGPFLTCNLWPLQILREAGVTLEQLATGDFVAAQLLENRVEWLSQMISGLGYPIITDDLFVPAYTGESQLSADEVSAQIRRVNKQGENHLWAIDLRQSYLDRWVENARMVLEADPNDYPRSQLWKCEPNMLVSPGLLWASYMAIAGHGRPPYAEVCQAY